MAVALAVSLISGVQGVILVRHSIEPRRLARFVLPALFGIPIGALLLDRVDADLLKLVVALFLIAYGIFVFKRMNEADFRRLLIFLMLVSGVVLLGRVSSESQFDGTQKLKSSAAHHDHRLRLMLWL